MLFAKPTRRYYRDDWLKIGELLGVTLEQAKRTTQARGEFADLKYDQKLCRVETFFDAISALFA